MILCCDTELMRTDGGTGRRNTTASKNASAIAFKAAAATTVYITEIHVVLSLPPTSTAAEVNNDAKDFVESGTTK